jgi:hypothetical protein
LGQSKKSLPGASPALGMPLHGIAIRIEAELRLAFLPFFEVIVSDPHFEANEGLLGFVEIEHVAFPHFREDANDS